MKRKGEAGITMREELIAILKEIKPTKNLENETAIVEEGYIDSFELMQLIVLMGERFDIEITVDDITPENFNSVDAMTKMIGRLQNK